MLYLISYDIESDRKRKKVSDRLLADGLIRVQYSVFIGPLSDPLQTKLLHWLQGYLTKPEAEHLILIPLQLTQLKKMTILGQPAWELAELTGEQHTLIL